MTSIDQTAGHDARARIVPYNSLAFPPSLEVSGGVRMKQAKIVRL